MHGGQSLGSSPWYSVASSLWESLGSEPRAACSVSSLLVLLIAAWLYSAVEFSRYQLRTLFVLVTAAAIVAAFYSAIRGYHSYRIVIALVCLFSLTLAGVLLACCRWRTFHWPGRLAMLAFFVVCVRQWAGFSFYSIVSNFALNRRLVDLMWWFMAWGDLLALVILLVALYGWRSNSKSAQRQLQLDQ